MACNIYILSCPIGAVGDECTFEIDCCSGQQINYTLLPDSIIEACVLEEGVVTVSNDFSVLSENARFPLIRTIDSTNLIPLIGMAIEVKSKPKRL